MHNSAMVNRGGVLWGAGYLLLAGVLLWLMATNPGNANGFPSQPTARIGLVAVITLPLAAWLAFSLSRMDHDAYVARWAVVAGAAVIVALIAAATALLPLDVFGCAALRGRLEALPETCSTTPAMRRYVFGEATVSWLLFGAMWLGWHRQRERRRRTRDSRTVHAAAS